MRAAVLQLNVSDDPERNLAVTLAYLAQAADGGAQIAFTPEVTNAICPDHDVQKSIIRPEAEDPTLAAVRAFAADQGMWVHLGSLCVQSGDPDGRFANRSFLVAPDGGIRARYDKIHMFDVDLTTAETYRESDRYRPGDRAVLADTEFAAVGMCICYDMRFPSLSDALAKAGAHILTYPSAFSRVSGAAHWESLLRARAIETGCWVVAAAQTGTHPTRSGTPRQTWGHSMVVDPWGDVRLDAGDEPGVHYVDLDFDLVADARRRIPALKNGRPFHGP